MATPNLYRASSQPCSPPPGDRKQALQVDHVHDQGVVTVQTHARLCPRFVQLCMFEPVTFMCTTLYL